ncbi:SDR family oxidoreductase, partial [Candidatus Binatus sp.]|uniref:SDR family oxidoreductase n=1 Tax=Candidatus Binatus sp. TaxID=2811406 RepID=UPI003C98D6FD
SGIGKACALYLDSRGWRVFAGVRKAADGEALAKAASPRLSPLILDVTDAKTVSDAATQVEKALGDVALIGIVNNAGIGTGGPVEFLDPSELRRQMDVNLVGPLTVIQAFMPMIRRGRGRIVNVSSVGGKVATPFVGPYCASKFALEALSDSLRAELKPWGIEVSLVEPGAVKTAMFEKARSTVDDVLGVLPAEGARYYGNEIEAMRGLIASQERVAVSAEAVARVVEHALIARRPRTRYLVGRDAKLMAFFHWLLPDRAFDRLLATTMRRLSRRASMGKAEPLD